MNRRTVKKVLKNSVLIDTVVRKARKIFIQFQISAQERIASGEKITLFRRNFTKYLVLLFFDLERTHSIRTLLQIESYEEKLFSNSALRRHRLAHRYKFAFYELDTNDYFEQCELGESQLTFEVVDLNGQVNRITNFGFPNETRFPRLRCRTPLVQLTNLKMSVDSSVFSQGSRAIWPLFQSNTSHLLNSHGAGSDVLAIFKREVALERREAINLSLDCVPFLLFGARSFEWGHWMGDFIMRVAFVKPPPGSTVIVDSRLSTHHLWWIKKIVPECRVVGVDLGLTVFFPDVNVLLPRTFCPPTWPSELGKPKSFFNSLPEDIRELSRLVKSSISVIESFSTRVWLRRVSGYRKIINEIQFEKLLCDLGFDNLEAESLDTYDLQKKLSNVDWIIGVVGSAFFNVVFCQKPCKVIMVTTFEDLQLNLIEQLQTLGHEVFVLFGRGVARRGAPSGHLDIQLSDESLKTLKQLISERK